jgi:membrane fusion protein, heavy metal efflux system
VKKILQLVSYLVVAVTAYLVIDYFQREGSRHGAHDATHAHGTAEHGHDDHGHGHGGDDGRPGLVYTHFSDASELFVEFPALVLGEESAFAVHLNDLNRFKPLGAGKVNVILSGGGLPDERFSVDGPSVPGIFRPVAIPKHAGERNLVIELVHGGNIDAHDLGEVIVYRTADVAARSIRDEGDPAGAISYLKEQAWKTIFASTAAESRSISGSVAAHATIRARPDGDAHILAPSQGKVIGAQTFPHIGRPVKKGELLAYFVPLAGDAVDVTQLQLAATRAGLAVEEAQREYDRAAGLLKEAAVPEKRVHEAEVALKSARAEVRAAESRLSQAQNPASDSGSRIQLRSPIEGVVAEVAVSPGALVQQGAPLFRVVDPSVLWLDVKVPEASLGKVLGATHAWFRIQGVDELYEVGGDHPGKLVASGSVVDPKTRTTSFLFEFPNPGNRLKVGMFADARLLIGEPSQVTAVPVSAVVDDSGQEVVYVQLGGETFERRPVTLGARQGDWVTVVEGVEPGERVVSRGAYNLKLASSSGSVPAHGHAH